MAVACSRRTRAVARAPRLLAALFRSPCSHFLGESTNVQYCSASRFLLDGRAPRVAPLCGDCVCNMGSGVTVSEHACDTRGVCSRRQKPPRETQTSLTALSLMSLRAKHTTLRYISGQGPLADRWARLQIATYGSRRWRHGPRKRERTARHDKRRQQLFGRASLQQSARGGLCTLSIAVYVRARVAWM